MKILVEVNTEKENEYVYSKVQCTIIHEWRNYRRFLNIDDGSYYQSKSCAENNGYEIISFEEFKSRYEPQLKIGDTFEHNGFVYKVLHQIDEKRWFRLKSPNNKDISYEKLDSEGLKDINHLYTKQEITDQEFIKQLEIHSK